MQFHLAQENSPLGMLLIVTDDQATVRALDFADYESRMQKLLSRGYGEYDLAGGRTPSAVRSALDSYFAGDLSAVENVPVATGGTEFQSQVWNRLRAIPAGTTSTYGELAEQLGRPGASRAVALANGANPVAIIVPCHRVIGANGALTGYGGGVSRKRWLLAHEAKLKQ